MGVNSFLFKNIKSMLKYYEYQIYKIQMKKNVSKMGKLGKNVIIHGNTKIFFPENISLGNNVWIGSNCFLNAKGGKISIGERSVISENVTIITFNHNYDSETRLPFDEKNIGKDVIIEDNVWVGLNCSVIPGIKVGEGAVIGMGSVVTKDIPPGSIVGGNPIKILKYRDMEKYEKVKRNMSKLSSDDIFNNWIDKIQNKELQMKFKVS